ncbi:MAG: quinone-dependent dihydroorotate dehydrogenase, partial [Anaerolineales bacterium]
MNYLRLRSLLFRLDPETAHRLTLGLLGLVGTLPLLQRFLRGSLSVSSPSLRVRVFGLDFANPIGLAAGYDKNGSAVDGLACLGFGHIELGTVTPRPQTGNPRPRIFRLPQEEALVNRMGFPNQGADKLADRLRRRKPPGIVVGVNLGKAAATPLEEAPQDYLRLIRLFHPWADYLVINLSSPNTPGLRRLQDGPALSRLLAEVASLRGELESRGARHVPLLVKLSPDLESGG